MTEVPTPRMFDHAVALYNELDSAATMDGKAKIFKGSRVEAFRSLRVSQAYYTVLYATLEEIGCIELLYRGRSGQPSIMKLYRPPTLDKFTAAYKRPLTKAGEPSTLELRVERLEGRLQGIDLAGTLVNFEGRLTAIESNMRKADGET